VGIVWRIDAERGDFGEARYSGCNTTWRNSSRGENVAVLFGGWVRLCGRGEGMRMR